MESWFRQPPPSLLPTFRRNPKPSVKFKHQVGHTEPDAVTGADVVDEPGLHPRLDGSFFDAEILRHFQLARPSDALAFSGAAWTTAITPCRLGFLLAAHLNHTAFQAVEDHRRRELRGTNLLAG